MIEQRKSEAFSHLFVVQFDIMSLQRLKITKETEAEEEESECLSGVRNDQLLFL